MIVPSQAATAGTAWRGALTSWAERFRHPGWGIAHSHRVYACGKWLLADGPHDDDALFAAAYLHDIGNLDPYAEPGRDHSERAAELAPGILAPMGFPKEGIERVQELVLHHMYSGHPGESPESVAFRDANTLDCMGAIGIARVLSMIGKHAAAPDPPSAIATLQRFRRDLPKSLVLPEAQEEGYSRCREMDFFFTGLSRQTYGMTRL